MTSMEEFIADFVGDNEYCGSLIYNDCEPEDVQNMFMDFLKAIRKSSRYDLTTLNLEYER